MDKLFSIFGDVTHTKLGGADSFTDQLSCKYTVYILSLVAIVATTKVFVDEPISCFCPSQFTNSQVEYTKKVCWVTNTHYVPFEFTHLPTADNPEKRYISYYQWIPLFLALQAVMFYLPRSIWKKLSRKSGVVLSNITDACIECQKKADQDGADKIMKYVTRYMGRFLVEFNRSHSSHRKCHFFWTIFKGNYLIQLYIAIKMMYVANVIGQLFLLNAFLGDNYHIYGIDVIIKIIRKQPWSTSERFPREVICDFQSRALGTVHRYSVQCVLPMNFFYEIVFIFIWFWFVFVALVTVGSLITWFCTSLCLFTHESYVKHRLIALDKVTKDQKKQISAFVRNHLRRDGCFIIKMVSRNSSDLIASELLGGLWDHFNSVTLKGSSRNSITDFTPDDDTNLRLRKREEEALKY